MEHIIYKILDEYGLSKPTVGDIEQRLKSLSSDDLEEALDKMDSWYASKRADIRRMLKDSDFFTVWIPRSRAESLNELSCRF